MDLLPKMPAFLDKQAQLSIADANETRLVILIRWVVKEVNGQHKKRRDLKNIIPNVQIPYIGYYAKIGYAIHNAFHPARLNNNGDDNVIVQRMLDLVKKPYYLQQTVEENGWARKRAIWILISQIFHD
ncbi:DDE Tnp4 domain-containing protein [Trichonephila clavipes]|nr:DDE Tnp4 domain-containing protein [Trichonephila clavipes]